MLNFSFLLHHEIGLKSVPFILCALLSLHLVIIPSPTSIPQLQPGPCHHQELLHHSYLKFKQSCFRTPTCYISRTLKLLYEFLRLGVFNNRNLFPYSCGGWEVPDEDEAALISCEASLCWLSQGSREKQNQ